MFIQDIDINMRKQLSVSFSSDGKHICGWTVESDDWHNAMQINTGTEISVGISYCPVEEKQLVLVILSKQLGQLNIHYESDKAFTLVVVTFQGELTETEGTETRIRVEPGKDKTIELPLWTN